jgi:hypothetical protein
MGPTCWGGMVVLHQQRPPNIPLIPTPASGFWPPVPLPTTPVPTVHPSHVDAAADFDRWRVEQLAATIPQESIATLTLSYDDVFFLLTKRTLAPTTGPVTVLTLPMRLLLKPNSAVRPRATPRVLKPPSKPSFKLG